MKWTVKRKRNIGFIQIRKQMLWEKTLKWTYMSMVNIMFLY